MLPSTVRLPVNRPLDAVSPTVWIPPGAVRPLLKVARPVVVRPLLNVARPLKTAVVAVSPTV